MINEVDSASSSDIFVSYFLVLNVIFLYSVYYVDT